MSLEMELKVDLGDGEATLTYDSNKAPMGINLSLSSDEATLTVRCIDIEKMAEFVIKAKKLLLMASVEEDDGHIDLEEEDDDDTE